MIHPSALLFIAALIVPASAGAATYSATPATAVAAKRLVARDISWACGPTACIGATEESRPVVLCQGLAKQVGRIEAFTVEGRAVAAAELAKCNTVARPTAQAAPARD